MLRYVIMYVDGHIQINIYPRTYKHRYDAKYTIYMYTRKQVEALKESYI